MDKYRLSPKLIIGVLIFLFFGLALILRVVLPNGEIFRGEWIKFSSNDAYYFMRLVDNLAQNYPHLTSFDPYFIFPGGIAVVTTNFFVWLMASMAWVFGLGHPTQHTIDIIGVYFPAILGALTVIPVYFIGKELFNRWAGAVAAGLIAILGGEFIGRSMLGYTDYHIAETFFSTVAVLFLIVAIKTAVKRGLDLSHLIKLRHPGQLSHEDRGIIIKPLVYSLLAGIFLGFYLITWSGGLLFVFIISLYLIVQSIIDHVRGKSIDYLGITGFITFLIALIIFLPNSPARLLSTGVMLAPFIPLALLAVSRAMKAYKRIKPAYYPLVLLGVGAIAILVFYAISPNLFGQMMALFGIFAPGGATAATTIEMQPFLSPEGSFSIGVAWGNFNTSFFLSLIGLLIILAYIIKERGKTPKELTLLFIWSLVILIATLAQRRFAYYFAVNVALLAGYISVLAYYLIRFIIDDLTRRNTDYMSWKILGLDGFGELFRQPKPPQERWERKKAKHHRPKEKGFRLNHIRVSIGIWLILGVFLTAFFPDVGMLGKALARGEEYGASFGEVWWHTCQIGADVDTVSTARYAPTDAWQGSLLWLKDNTPDPFGDPDAYYQIYERPAPGEDFAYPASAYGVTSWWDYGYWITRIARRLPNANPSQDSRMIKFVAYLYLSHDWYAKPEPPPGEPAGASDKLKPEEASAAEIVEELGSAYIITDYATSITKFHAVATWVGKDETDYYNVYYVPIGDQLIGIPFYYPDYFRSLIVRLYNFDGQAVTDVKPLVLTYEDKISSSGVHYKQVTDIQDFSTYQEALDYVGSQTTGKHVIVSSSPFISPIPLDAVENYQLVHSSEETVTHQDLTVVPDIDVNSVALPEVKIFEYTGD